MPTKLDDLYHSFYKPTEQTELKSSIEENHKEFDKSRKLNDFEKSQYYPVTQGAFGCYRISRKRQTECLDKSKKYTINDLLGMDIYATDSQVLDNYYDYKEQIFKSIGVYMND